MNAKKLLPLLVLLAALVAVVVIQKSGKKPVSISEQVQLAALIDEGLAAKDIAKLELYAGAKPEEKVVLEKDGEVWRVASNFNAPVKEETLEAYLEDLFGVKGEFRATASDEAALSDYSLKEEEAFHVKAYKADSETPCIDLYFGKAPSYTSVLLRQAGDMTVYVEDTNLRQKAGIHGDDMEKAPTADTWLDKEICKLDKAEVTKIALTLPDKEIVFEQQAKEVPQPEEEAVEEPAEDGAEDAEKPVEKPAPVIEYEWKLVSGGITPDFKQPGLDKILQKLSNFTANDVVDPAKKADWALESPAFKAVISLKDKDDVVLEAGRPDAAGDGYVRLAQADTEVIYEVSKYNFEQLFPKGADLFNLPKQTVKKDAITQVEITQPEGRVVLSQADGKWSVMEPTDALDVQEATLTALATALSSWKATDYAGADVDAGSFDSSITILAGEKTHRIDFGAASKSIDGRYVKIDGGDQVLVMSAPDVKKMLLLPQDVYQMALFNDVKAEEVTGLDMVLDGASFSVNKEGEAWKLLIDGAVKEADPARCDAVVSELIGLQASGFRFDVPADSWTPQTSVTLRLSDGGEHKLAVSAEKDGAYLMSVAGKTSLFSAEKSDIDPLRAMIELAKEEKKPEPEPVKEAAADSAEKENTAPVVELEAKPAAEAATPAVKVEASPAMSAPVVQMNTTPPAPAPSLKIEAPAPAATTPAVQVEVPPSADAPAVQVEVAPEAGDSELEIEVLPATKAE